MKTTEFYAGYWARTLITLANALGYPLSKLPKNSQVDELEKSKTDCYVGDITFDGVHPPTLDIPVGFLLNEIFFEDSEGVRSSCGEFESADAIYGFAQHGTWYCLREVEMKNFVSSAPGLDSQVLRGVSLTAANKPISNHPTVDRISISLDGLGYWFQKNPITISYNRHDNQGTSKVATTDCSIKYNSSGVGIITLFKDDEITIEIRQKVNKTGHPTLSSGMSVKVEHYLVVELNNPSDFDETLEKWIYPLRNLMTLFLGRFTSINSISAHEFHQNCTFSYYTAYVDPESPISRSEAEQIPFPYSRLESHTQEILGRWSKLDQDTKNVSTIITSLTNNWRMPVDLEFVACASAFEALSRVNQDEKCFDEETFNREFSQMTASISNEKFKNWIQNLVRNRKSAGSLARSLFTQLKPFSESLIPNKRLFLQDHRVCRNTYVHRSETGNSQLLREVELYFHTQAVWLLSYAAILNLIGIQPEKINNAIQEAGYKVGVREKIKNMYE